MLRGLFAGVLCAALLVVLGTAPVASARTCSVAGKERKLGATYVTSLSATGVSCRKAESVVKAFHKCRRKNGAAGRCRSSVQGFKCRETRLNAIATQYDARVRCKRGGRVVRHTYQQFT